jgi:tetratricopeptide (TPR) repeat protein
MAEERGDFALAIREYQAEIEAHPDHYKAQFNIGRLYGQVGDHGRQEAAFRRAIELNGHFAEGHLFLAKLYLDLQRNYDEAITLARRGLELAPSSTYAPLGHYILADIYAQIGRAAESRQEAARGRALEARLRDGGAKSD